MTEITIPILQKKENSELGCPKSRCRDHISVVGVSDTPGSGHGEGREACTLRELAS